MKKILTFEHKKQSVATRRKFLLRLCRTIFASLLIIGLSLFFGILGYHYINHLSWIDSLLDASMILTGMGPVHEMKNNAAKVFASLYALFSGVVFLVCAGVFFAPIFHRILHKFHVDIEEK